ncbi:5639_t:CDS:2 [Diversispora eburnea]|uniref:5639_t:CDS:1 n=1 Tax=Diversispora eburnea TaxID=1213867 RepID=A0A9N8W424_9GLOM|nr:5639_t:CDS:2 [Diversispora eburnea]
MLIQFSAPTDTYGQNFGKPTSLHFNPYDDNGGTALALSGEDYAIIASDTRQSSVLAMCGFSADASALTKRITQRMEWYKHAHEKEMSTEALSQLLSITLYSKRFFPYYTHCLLGGLDENGSFHAEPCCAVGSGSPLMQSFLDNQNKQPIPLEKAINIVKDSFTGVAERDIYTGDGERKKMKKLDI